MIGGGWLGLEVAAAARKRGLTTTVVEAGPRLCGRAAPPELSDYLQELHASHGVSILLETGIAEITRTEVGLAVKLSNGDTLQCGIGVVAVGLQPNLDLAANWPGLAVDKGILVDEFCRTSDPNIYAIGDCTEAFHPYVGQRIRLESWQNANTQANVAAAAIMGADAPQIPLLWFWSDQYDRNVQMLGDLNVSSTRVVRGDTNGSFSILYMDGTILVGILAVNCARDIGMARRLIGRPLNASMAANPQIPLSKSLEL